MKGDDCAICGATLKGDEDTCDQCGQAVCGACMYECQECGDNVCGDCLADPDAVVCGDCVDKRSVA